MPRNEDRPKPARQRRRVLVVEDEDLLREIVTIELTDAGYEVIEAATGEAALGLIAARDDIDALFTDIRLPGAVDGWRVAKEFRVRYPDGPVFYATAYSSSQDLVDRSMFFRKPFKLPQLVLCLRAQLGGEP